MVRKYAESRCRKVVVQVLRPSFMLGQLALVILAVRRIT